jgi:chromate transporter
MKAGVSAVIMSVVFDMASGIVKTGDVLNILLMAAAFIANYYLHINVVIIIGISIVLGIVRSVIQAQTSKKGN